MENTTRKLSGVEVHVVPAGLFTLFPSVHVPFMLAYLSDYQTIRHLLH